MEKENSDLRKNLEFAHKSIGSLTELADTQKRMLSRLVDDVDKIIQVSNAGKQRTRKLESHSRRNSLIF